MTYATCVAHFRADAIVVGTGFNLLAASLTVFLSIAFFGSQSGTAVLEVNQKFHPLLWGQYAIGFIVLLLPLLSYWIYKNTAWGLRMRAAGENPTQLKSLGFSLTGVRFSALLATGICLGLGGSYLSLCMNSGFIKNMSAGMGFLGLAALICGAWRPLPTLFFALLFSFVDVLQTEIASHEYSFGRVPSSLSQSFPYIIGLIVLVIMGQKSGAPKALGEHE